MHNKSSKFGPSRHDRLVQRGKFRKKGVLTMWQFI